MKKPKPELSNVIPLRARPARRERLNKLDCVVLALVRQHRDPVDAGDYFEQAVADGRIEASLAKLERLGRIKRATGYVATARGPEAQKIVDERGRKVWRPEAIANEFCVPVDAVEGIVRRVGIEPGTTYTIHKAG